MIPRFPVAVALFYQDIRHFYPLPWVGGFVRVAYGKEGDNVDCLVPAEHGLYFLPRL